jgi:4-hydroxybenzoate polyprenyltransferase/phosphoserine phosphatase
MGIDSTKETFCVDLDYTLVNTDILFEQILQYLKKNPLRFFTIIFWLLKSKKYLKKKLYETVQIDYSSLPYRNEVIEFLKEKKREQHKLFLVTASYHQIGMNINSHLKLFDDVYGSDSTNSLKGKSKAKFLAEKFGKGNFTYIGDSISDFPIWKIAQKAYLVSNSNFMHFLLKSKANYSGCLLQYRAKIADFLRLIRIHQWLKNLLIFLPLLLAHEFKNLIAIEHSFLAFLSFSFIASGMYIFNDIVDIENDRRHPKKKFRPVASGIFSVYTALAISASIFLLGVILALQINTSFLAICAIYIFLNFFYSFWIKYLEIINIFCLSLFYVIRLYAGSLATDIQISNWLLAFSIFIFLSLAVLKKFTELKLSNTRRNTYNEDGDWLDTKSFYQVLGITSSFSAVIVFILYINSPKVLELYKEPLLLWIDAFLLLLWLTLIWNFAVKGKVNYDPVLEVIKNPYLIFLEVLMIIVWILAIIL